MKMEKQAAQDAVAWLGAEMAYGEGSGTRRKLVYGPIQQRMLDNPEYEQAFMAAYDKLDVDKFAKLAIRDHKMAVRAAKAGQNLRALKSGNVNNLTTGVAVVVGVAYVAHKTGYDKVIEQKVRNAYSDLKIEIKVRRARAKLKKEEAA